MKINSSFALKDCGGFVRTGVLILLIVAIIAAFLLHRGLGTVRWGMAECIRWQAMILSERFILVDQEHVKLEELMQEFAQKIAEGNVSSGKGFAVLRALYNGPLLHALLCSSIKNQLQTFEDTRNTDLSGFEKTSIQFFLGVKSGKVPPGQWDKVKKLLMEDKICETVTANGLVIPENIEIFKKGIGLNSIFNCMAVMNEANKDAETTADDATLDSVEELRKILGEAMVATP